MERRIGPLRAEVVDPESAKFTAPLLLLHGLWSTPLVWRSFTGYLAHRGWLSVAPYLQSNEHENVSIDAYLARIRGAIAALPAPPVIIGHDLGGTAAFAVADAATAVVALAPLVLPPLGVPPNSLREAGSWLDRLTSRERPLRPPRGRWRASYPPLRGAQAEPARLLRELAHHGVELAAAPSRPPALILIGDKDPVTSHAMTEALAARVSAEVQIEAGAGHALPSDNGWEQRVSGVHRWIVHAVGKPLLALFDESFDP
jgi:pimeloyl-ACP methyl ester carboxylesterase